MKSALLLTVGSALLVCLSSGCVAPAVSGGYHGMAAGRATAPHLAGDRAAVQAGRRDDRPPSDVLWYQAQSCWERDDVVGCRQLLEELLQRDPDHRDATLLRAEVALLDGQPRRVMSSVRRLCARRSEDAQAQHMMAILLDAAGRRGEAIAYYEAAVSLEPDDDLYQLSFKAATGADADILQRQGPAAAGTLASREPDLYEPDASAGEQGGRWVETVSYDEVPQDGGAESQEPEYLQLEDLPAPMRSARMTARVRGLPALRRGSRTFSRTAAHAAAAATASDQD